MDNSVRYFTSERDGPDVDSSVLDRQPANLTDEKAYVYADPRYDSNDNLLGTLKKTGGPVDVSGGWFDAGGGYEKFGYTASYADALMLLAARDDPNSYDMLQQEAAFGLQWITKLWNPARKVLYAQVGIGTGNASNTIQGDYNFWFLPQQEDRMNVRPGREPRPERLLRQVPAGVPGRAARPEGQPQPGRPVRRRLRPRRPAGRPGSPIRRQAAHLLSLARGVYAMAKTTNVGQLVTAFPHDFYPATQWKSDMLWGAAEIALADEATGAPAARVRADLADRGPVGPGVHRPGTRRHVQPLRHRRGRRGRTDPGDAAGRRLPGLAGDAAGDMAAQLRAGRPRPRATRSRSAPQLGDSDASPHAFGLFITDALYQKYGGSRPVRLVRAAAAELRARRERLGHLLRGRRRHGVPALHAERDRQPGGLAHRHAVTSSWARPPTGRAARTTSAGLGTVDGMRACSAGHFAPFNTKTAAYEDNVVSWPSVEPADDYTANSLLAFALGADQGSGLG